MPADEPNPEQIYHDSRLGPDLQAALDSLPPEFRAAVVLCDIEGLSYEEIGATLGVKLGTVRSRIHRGRQALREYLAAHSEHRRARRQVGLSCVSVRHEARYIRCSPIRAWHGAPRGGTMADPGHVFRRAFSWLPSHFASQNDAPVGAPRQFGSTEHLSTEAIAAFVDGELRMNAHLRAAHHLSLCPAVRREVEGQRQARAALRDSRPIDCPRAARHAWAHPAPSDSRSTTG